MKTGLLSKALSFFTDDEKKVTSSASQPVKRKKAQLKTGGSAAKPTVKKKPAQAKKVVTMLENLPAVKKLISGLTDKSAIRIPKNQYGDYIVAETESDDVLILCAEHLKDLAVDNNFLKIANKCRSLGYKPKKVFVTKNVMKIILETHSENANKDEVARSKTSIENLSDEGEKFLEIATLAKKMGASDIFLLVRKELTTVKFKVRGKTVFIEELTYSEGETISRITYSKWGGLGDVTFVSSKPQAAKMKLVIAGELTEFRLQSFPDANGFDMTYRLLAGQPKELQHRELTTLGFNKTQDALLTIADSKPIGVHMLVGVTGSGKTTTLATRISNIMWETNGEKRVLTIEDPTEIMIKGVTHGSVVRKKGKDKDDGSTVGFNDLMGAALRSAPDIIMPGEIRDAEGAKLLVAATQSGHSVLTTVHCPSGFGAYDRLRELGISNSILASDDFIASITYQSLVPVLCAECSLTEEDYLKKVAPEKLTLAKRLISRVHKVAAYNESLNVSNVRYPNTEGCKKCAGGHTGVEVMAEVIIPDSHMRQCIREGNDEAAKDYYKNSGGMFLRDHGLEKVFSGRCDPASIERRIGMIDASSESLSDILAKIAKDISEDNATEGKPKLESSLNLKPNKVKNVVDLTGTKKDNRSN